MKMNTWMDNAAVAAVLAAIVFNVLHGAYLGATEGVLLAATPGEVRHG